MWPGPAPDIHTHIYKNVNRENSFHFAGTNSREEWISGNGDSIIPGVLFNSSLSRFDTVSTIFIGISKIKQRLKHTLPCYPGKKRNDNSLKNAATR